MGREKHPLRLWLAAQGRTADEFAKEIDYSPSVLSEWLTRSKSPSLEAMIVIARATGGEIMPNDFLPPDWKD